MKQPKPIKRFRFAPSPNGAMHFGHAYSALLNVVVAKAVGGEFIIRMEDIDQIRCKKEFSDAFINDMFKIGVYSEFEIMYQSKRGNAYKTAIDKLLKIGVLYPCLATRGDIKQFYKQEPKQYDPDGALLYPMLYKGKTEVEKQRIIDGQQPYALRLDMKMAVEIIRQKGADLKFLSVDIDAHSIRQVEFDPMVWGDVVLARKDIATSYHLSVVVDDAAQNITHIIRGEDLYEATYIHRILQILLDLPKIVYYHHRLILDKDLKKLAKSNDSAAVKMWLEQNREVKYFSDLLKRFNISELSDIVKNILCDSYEKK